MRSVCGTSQRLQPAIFLPPGRATISIREYCAPYLSRSRRPYEHVSRAFVYSRIQRVAITNISTQMPIWLRNVPLWHLME